MGHKKVTASQLCCQRVTGRVTGRDVRQRRRLRNREFLFWQDRAFSLRKERHSRGPFVPVFALCDNTVGEEW
jgi:hypothetical protein